MLTTTGEQRIDIIVYTSGS